MRKIGSKTGLTAAKARASIVRPPEKEVIKIAPEEGLAFLLHNNFSREQYKAVWAKSKGDRADIWPSYMSVQNAKLECRATEISVEDHFAVVPLQNLLDHTTRGIVQSNLDLEAKMFQIAEQNGGQLSATL